MSIIINMIKVNKTSISFGDGRRFTRIKVNHSYVVEINGSARAWVIEPYGFDIAEGKPRHYNGSIKALGWILGTHPKRDELHTLRILASDIISIREARNSEI